MKAEEQVWSGNFGDEYIERNKNEAMIKSNTALFLKIFNRTAYLNSILEFGANVGFNLRAVLELKKEVEVSAVEINHRAVKLLRQWKPDIKVYHGSALDFKCDYQRDFVFTKGLLIHINPNDLPTMYEKLYETSRRYIAIAEYYDPKPVEIPYRGMRNVLFKRDFAGEMMDKYPDLKLVDYGFVYHRDPKNPQDDITWFLMEKQ